MLHTLLLAYSLCALTPAALQDQVVVPAHSAYSDDSTADAGQLALWFGRIRQPGELNVQVSLALPLGSAAQLRLQVAGQESFILVEGRDGLQQVDFGNFVINGPGYERFEVAQISHEGRALVLDSLQLTGPAAEGAHFNTKPRKNAASVHLAYPLGELAEVEAFYCEVTAKEDPLWTYYMATGWHRGYFGMQVNSASERRIIFSVWDSGGEAVDRDKVNDSDRVQLIDRGSDVVTGSFGNEGTGGHSHLVFDWKTGERQRFLVTAKADDATHTTFAGYYFRPDMKAWMLISSWRAPKEGSLLRGLYSFSENFGGQNGHVLRRASFGNQWVRTKEGLWTEITGATFSHDATGRADRLDRYMGIEDGEFFLSHGGFVEGEGTFGELFEREPIGTPPNVSSAFESGKWRAVLDSPGGELPFTLSFQYRFELETPSGESYTVDTSEADSYAESAKSISLVAHVQNGAESIEAGAVELVGDLFTMELEPYDSRIVATLAPDGRTLTGHWEKNAGPGHEARLPFTAHAGDASRFQVETARKFGSASGEIPASVVGKNNREAASLGGRWRVQFDSDENLSVGLFDVTSGGRVDATFLTTMGDYRYLSGAFSEGRLRLSSFDGGHAFLFDATMDEEGRLSGDFWSRDSWHEKWTAVKDKTVELPDSFGLTSWNREARLGDFSYLDSKGAQRALDDPEFAGKARLITLFGTWCPNCNDEASYLAELDQRYGERGLSILGVAFELTDDLSRSVEMVERFQTRHNAKWPVLYGSLADKEKASETLSGLDRIRAYPTVLFVDANNEVRAVHTGFAGPATGAAHRRMRERYEALIDQLLSE
jgi:thiol-disulfide isomerase/thioredoxin